MKPAYDGPLPRGRALKLNLAPGGYSVIVMTPRCAPMDNFFVVGTHWNRRVTIDSPGWPRTIRTKFGTYEAVVPDIHPVPHVGVVVHAPPAVTNVVMCVNHWPWRCEQANHQGNVWYFDAADVMSNPGNDTLTIYEGKRPVATYAPTLQRNGLFERFLGSRP